MRRLYTVLLYLLTPFILCRLYWKGRRLPAYRKRLSERFMVGAMNHQPVDVWIHAVSLGEVVAVTPLATALVDKHYRVLITTITPTGSERVRTCFGERVLHQYLPYDLPLILRRFYRAYQPDVGIIMETELWPNLIYEAQRIKLPLLLANARISNRAYKQYQKAAFVFKPVLKQLTAIFAQSMEDANRFKLLGAPSERVSVLGNMKFDLHIDVNNKTLFQHFKERWGQTRPVMIAASTHEHEEEQLLAGFKRLQKTIPDMLLVIAPRHPERFQEVHKLSKLHFNTGLRSEPEGISQAVEVVILDTLGELLGFYQISDYAFVGGSLVPVGGHNVLEAIALNIPVMTGPHMQNSKAICQELCAAGAMRIANNMDELVSDVIQLHNNQDLREKQINNANAVLAANQGCLERYLKEVEHVLSEKRRLNEKAVDKP